MPGQPACQDGQADRLRGHLLARIHRRFKTRVQSLDFGAVKLQFVRVENPDVVLDEVATEEELHVRLHGKRAAEEEPQLPYWAELWDSAAALAGVLAADPERVRGKAVLDLGCGMGLAGTAAAALGGKVLFADLEPHALLFAALNSLAFGERARTRRVDWRGGALGERFEIILGADILYERDQWDYLEPFWRAHLSPGGKVMLGEPGRPKGEEFPAWAAARGWSVHSSLHGVSSRPEPVKVLVLTL
jgi:predicted nicotinamide N-methyase